MIRIEKGNSPLVLCLPHSGSVLPDAVLNRFNATGRLQTDMSWRLEQVLTFAAELDATLIRTTVSRYVVDVDKDPSRADPSNAAGNSLCPTATLDGKRIYRPDEEPGPTEIEQRLLLFHKPFHDALRLEINRLRHQHKRIVLIDCQSMRSRIRGVCDGGLPIVSIGSGDGRSCDPELRGVFANAFDGVPGFSVGVDDSFSGGYITTSCGQPDHGVHAMTMVLAQRSYLRHESPPFEPDKSRIGDVRAAVASALSKVVGWTEAARHESDNDQPSTKMADTPAQQPPTASPAEGKSRPAGRQELKPLKTPPQDGSAQPTTGRSDVLVAE